MLRCAWADAPLSRIIFTVSLAICTGEQPPLECVCCPLLVLTVATELLCPWASLAPPTCPAERCKVPAWSFLAPEAKCKQSPWRQWEMGGKGLSRVSLKVEKLSTSPEGCLHCLCHSTPQESQPDLGQRRVPAQGVWEGRRIGQRHHCSPHF